MEQKRDFQRQWFAYRRLRGIELLGGQCIQCESTDNLEFDHTDPDSKDLKLRGDHRPGFPWSWSWSRIEEELEKCQLLCGDCHKIKTLEMFPERQHGTVTMYDNSGCRCDLCKEASRKQKAAWRLKSDRN